jgi:hypothetical protein
MQGTSRSELAAQLDRCARLCEEITSVYVERDDERDRDVVCALLLAAAALETASGAVEEQSSSAPAALLIAGTLARDTIDAAERRGLDARLAHCCAELRAAVEACR